MKMKIETFAKRAALMGLAGLFALTAGCGSSPPRRDTPVRDASSSASRQPVAARPGEHIVRQGETLYAVSRMYGVPVQDLISWNGLTHPERLEVGQALRVAPPSGVPSASGAVAVPIAPQPGFEPLTPTPAPQDTATATPTAPATTGAPEVKYEPRGGKEPYSDAAWARLQAPAGGVESPTTTLPPSTALPPATPVVDWLWPVAGGKVISRFDDTATNSASAKGIDISGAAGTPILAAAAGEVFHTGTQIRQYGNLIIIKHDDNYLTAYGHNRAILVKKGDKVARGQKIAEMGDTGTSPRQTKLHFELRIDGKPVDPLKHLREP
jgi:lipoprotein NlpD